MTVAVDTERHAALARNHTATHLLHTALRQVLGNHVNQAGSLVTPDHLRFDFTHFSPVTAAELREAEQLVNREILKNTPVMVTEMNREEAKQKGATALFGEKYGDVVRVVSIGDFSCELCGGSHVKSTAEVGTFRIISESGTGTGVRRIEAITGAAALSKAQAEAQILAQAAAVLKVKPESLVTKLTQLAEELKITEREVQRLKKDAAAAAVDRLAATTQHYGSVAVSAAVAPADDMDGLRTFADLLLDKQGGGVVLLGMVHDGKVNFVCKVAKADTKKRAACRQDY